MAGEQRLPTECDFDRRLERGDERVLVGIELFERPGPLRELSFGHGLGGVDSRRLFDNEGVGVPQHDRPPELPEEVGTATGIRAALHYAAEADDRVWCVPIESRDHRLERDGVGVNV